MPGDDAYVFPIRADDSQARRRHRRRLSDLGCQCYDRERGQVDDRLAGLDADRMRDGDNGVRRIGGVGGIAVGVMEDLRVCGVRGDCGHNVDKKRVESIALRSASRRPASSPRVSLPLHFVDDKDELASHQALSKYSI